MTRIALIAGAGGAASKRLIETLLADDWSVLALARTPRRSVGPLTWIAADLFDGAACAKALAAHRGVTHLFYTARAKHGETGLESVEDNVAMLRNVLDAVEPVGDRPRTRPSGSGHQILRHASRAIRRARARGQSAPQRRELLL